MDIIFTAHIGTLTTHLIIILDITTRITHLITVTIHIDIILTDITTVITETLGTVKELRTTLIIEEILQALEERPLAEEIQQHLLEDALQQEEILIQETIRELESVETLQQHLEETILEFVEILHLEEIQAQGEVLHPEETLV